MGNPLETLNPGQIITITKGFYRNALGVYKVLKPVTKDVIDSSCQNIMAEIREKDFEVTRENWDVYPDEYMNIIPDKLIVMGYIEKIDAAELFLGYGIVEPETLEA